MSEGILIGGRSGSGKTYATRNLDNKSTFYISTTNKRIDHLPIENRLILNDPPKGLTKNTLKTSLKTKLSKEINWVVTDKAILIGALLEYVDEEMSHIKRIIIDDWQYSFANHFMRRISEKNFNKFNDIGHEIWFVATLSTELKRKDLITYFLTHTEFYNDIEGVQHTKIKTLGKVIDNTFTLEGLFEIVVYAETNINDNKQIDYCFRTKTDGYDSVKTPVNMFEKNIYPNDLVFIDQQIRKHYKI